MWRMHRSFAILALSCALGAWATSPAASLKDRTLPFGCADIVVIGMLKNDVDSYEHVEIPNDILGHGWMRADLHVRKVVKGLDVPASLPVRYFGHTYFREDRDFMFVVSGNGRKGYKIKTAQLMEVRPRLASRCG